MTSRIVISTVVRTRSVRSTSSGWGASSSCLASTATLSSASAAPAAALNTSAASTLPLLTASNARHASSATGSVDSSSSGDYVSPFADLFENIANGKTSFGTDTTKDPPLPPPPETRVLKCGIPESFLRFRTTSYGRMAIEPHVQPGEHKVMLKVSVSRIPLESDLEHQIFRQIVGRRYLPEKNELRLSSDQFASRIENKRHLVSMLDRIVINTKRLAKEVALAEGGETSS